MYHTAIIPTGRGDTTPRHLRVYANYPNIIDFNDAESTKPHLNISLSEGETAVVEYPLRVAAFTSVHSLSLYLVSYVPSFMTRINELNKLSASQLAENVLVFTSSDSKEMLGPHGKRGRIS